MYALALAALAVLFIAVAPRIMARRHDFRRSPRAALIAWQSIALAGVIAALAAAPVAVVGFRLESSGERFVATTVAVAVSGLALVSLLVNGHVIGTRLRAARRRHRDLLELVGHETGADADVEVLPHETPTAYCVPGLRGRVVLTEGALSRLSDDELAAVLAHERAHLGQRHDLVLEFFSVLHRAAPPPIRAPQALREVTLLIEVLADRAARARVGEVPLARALVTLAGGETPAATLGMAGPWRRILGSDSTPQDATLARMRLLAHPPAPRPLTALMYVFSAAVLAAPLACVVLAVVA